MIGFFTFFKITGINILVNGVIIQTPINIVLITLGFKVKALPYVLYILLYIIPSLFHYFRGEITPTQKTPVMDIIHGMRPDTGHAGMPRWPSGNLQKENFSLLKHFI